jgi:2-keto-3-deoxy-L-rhamnonate aldolase RhmA
MHERAKIFKEKIRSGSVVSLGSWQTMAHPSISEIMCKSGFEWVCVDLEHSSIGLREAEDLIRIIDLSGKIPLVRLSSNDSVQIKRVMDSGAYGIIVPVVNTLKNVTDAYEAMHFPTEGKRGVGLARAQSFGPGFSEYHDHYNERATFMIQIEHVDAIPNLREIFSHQGIDAYFIGPYDLSASMGIAGEFENEDFKDKVNQIKEIAAEMGVTSGIHIVEPDTKELSNKIKEGFKFIAYGVDFRFLDVSCREGVLTSQESMRKL